MFVMVKPGWPGDFHRSVFGLKGERLRLLKFQPGEVYEVDGENLTAIGDDLDKALVEVIADGKDRPRTKDGIAVAMRADESGPLDPTVPAEEPPVALDVEAETEAEVASAASANRSRRRGRQAADTETESTTA